MPTLREAIIEANGPLSIGWLSSRTTAVAGFKRGIDAALRDYGDYEIVKGKLSANIQSARIYEEVFCKGIYVGDVRLGMTGEHVKLLVPPRKPVAERDQQPSERENTYKLALQEIKDCCFLTGLTGISIATKMAQFAQDALEEKEDDSR